MRGSYRWPARRPGISSSPAADSATAGNRLTLTAAYTGAEGYDTLCVHELTGIVTATLASLVTAEADPRFVRLRWRAQTRGPVTVYRATTPGLWSAVGTLD